MDFLRPVKKFDEYQQRRKWLAIPVAVIKKFGDDGAGNQAALVAYFAFFSLFPLLLVFVTIVGFVLQGDPSAQESVFKHVTSQFPALGNIKSSSIHGSVLALVIGIVTSLLSGLGVTNAAQNALDRVWAVPIKDRANFLYSRLRGIALLFLIGGLFIISSGASGLVSGGPGGPLAFFGGIAVSLLFNVALFGAAFRLMTSRDIPTSDLRVGVLVAAGFWEILQVFGGYYIGHALKHTSPSLAAASFVIGLLLFFHLGAQLTLYAAEINVVISRGLWPRRLIGAPEMPADEETLTALAKVEERSEVQKVEVSFGDNGHEQSGKPAGPIRWTNRVSRRRRSGRP